MLGNDILREVLNQRPAAFNREQWSHSGFPPVPSRLFSRSMLLPSVQFVLLWCTDCLIECHGDFLGIAASFAYFGASDQPAAVGPSKGRGVLVTLNLSWG
jgi:hypothetical protein